MHQKTHNAQVLPECPTHESVLQNKYVLHHQVETKSHLTDFIHHYDLQGVVLTHGSEGAELLTSDNEHFKVEPIANLEIKDTVGAGDAFASIIIFGLKNNWPLADTIERAQQFASAIVQNRGATVNDKNFYIDFLKTWEII